MCARLAALALLLTPGPAWAQSGQATEFFTSLKDIPIGGDARLSFSGELRERFESYTSPAFGLRGFTLDQYLLQRIMLGAELTVAPYFRAFVQLDHEVQVGRNPVTPADSNHLDFHQAFLEFKLPVGGSFQPMLRAGRQEITLGTQRLVSNKDGPNIRRNFDGFRVLASVAGTAVDLIAYRPTFIRDAGPFDDMPDNAQSLWGIYTTTPISDALGLKADVYYLGYENRLGFYNGITANEVRHTFGTRLFGALGDWDYNFEGALQAGLFGAQQIAAWMGASDTGVSLPQLPWFPRIGLKANIYSGNPVRGGKTLGTFNPLFPRLNRETMLLTTANYVDVLPTLRLRPTDSLTIEMGWDFLWRQSTQDAIYQPPFFAYPRTAQSTGATIGNQVFFDVTWQASRHLALGAAYVHFNAGETITQAGGSDVDLFVLQGTFRF